MKLRINAKLRAALIAAFTTVGFTLPQSYAAATVITLGEITAEPTQECITDSFVLNGAGNTNYNLSDGSTLAMALSGGKFWGNKTDGALSGVWTNETALGEWNNIINGGFTAADLTSNNYSYTASGAGWSSATLTLDSDLYTPDTSIITLYTTVTRRGGALGNFSVTGLDNCQISYATNTGDGFSDTAAFSGSANQITLIKVTGTITGDAIQLKSNENTNGWQTISYVINTPIISTYTWHGTDGNNDWSGTVWNEPKVPFGENGDAVFDSTGYEQVAITTSVIAHNVAVGGKDYTFALSGDGSLTANALTVTSVLDIAGAHEVSAASLSVGANASVSLTDGSTLAVNGGVTLGEGSGITVGTGTTLKVSSGDVAKALMMGTGVTNNGVFEIAGNVTLDNGATTKMGGALKVDSGVTLKLSSGKDNPTSIESFSSVELAGGNLWANTTMRTINALSVTGDSQISFDDFPDAHANNPTKFTGTTRIESGKTLTVYTNYKSSIQIAGLAGAGTLKLTTGNRSDNGENVTIDTLAGFTGNISLAPGNANNPVRVTAALGNADVSMDTLSLNNNSAAASAAKHTFFKLTGEHNLTLKGIDGTNGEVSLAVPTLTLDTASNHSYTGSLAIGGALVKTGSGTQTISGYTMYKAITVQGGTLVLNGDYAIDGLANDPDTVTTYQDAEGNDTTAEQYGFMAQEGYRTVYTENGGTLTLADGARFTLGGNEVTLEENGKYKLSSTTDYTTLWVKGNTPLSYDTYYNASGNALTTAKVAGGATLVLGEHAVGTLAYQENGTTINLSGTGTVNAISGTGTLNLENGAVATLGYNPVIASGQTFTTTGAGTLEVTTLENNGGTMNLGSHIKVTGGGQGTGNDPRKQGLYLHNVNGTVNLTGTADITGAMYASEGTVVIGDGINAARVEVNRVEFGDTQSGSNASILTINAHATLHVKAGDAAKSYSSTGILLGEWEGSSTANIYGNLYAENATAYVGDKQVTYNIENDGVMAVKGIGVNEEKSGKSETINLNLKDGGKLVLGANGISSNKTFNAEFGHAEVGMTADTTLAKAITLTSAEGTTFNTTKYKWEGEGDQLTLTPDTTGGTMTVSGALSGTGKLVAAGAGTLELSGANTHAGTVVNGGTLKAASAGALGSGDVTVNAGALELTTTTAVAGALTINDGTLKLAGQNMLTADTLALGSGTVTFDLSNISVSHAGTITLATATTSADLGSATVQVVWEGLAPIFSHEGVQVSGNSWIITLTSTSQDLYWHGGTANWDATALSWHTEAAPEEPVAFNSGDTAIFAADPTQAVANISGALVAGGVIVREGADVVLQKATEAQEASISAPEIEISGALVSSVDMTATDIVGRGTDATWEIAAGSTVTTATLSADEGATLTISGGGSLSAGTVTGDGTIVFTGDIQPEYSKIVVAEGKELELKGSVTRTISKDNLAIDGKLVIGEDYSLDIDGQYNPGITGTDLHIRNNGNLAVSLGNDQNVLRMDGQSAGNLEIKSGYISYLSELGNQTLVMDNGTQLWFGNNAGAQDNPDFTNDIALNGDVTLRVYGSNNHASVTISGDVDGAGHTLTKTDGNQVLTFTGTVTLGGLNVEGSGEKLVFKGSGSNLGAIKATSGAFTIQFSKADGEGTASYTFDTFAMSPDNHGATRWLIVDAGVTVEGTGDTLSDEHATIMNSWGINNGGLEVNGTLITKGVIGMDSGDNTSYIKGTGTINTKGLDLCNVNTTYIQGGITVNITSDTGIYRRNHGNASTIHLLDATLQAKDADWEFKDQNDANYTVTLDSASGTTFDAATGHTITLSKGMGGSGKLVKAGEGTVLAKGTNTYSGGTEITAGTLETKNASALGTGNVSVGGNGTLLVSENLTIKGDSTAANNGLDNQGIVSIADGKTLTLWGLAAAKHYNLGTVNAAGDSAIIENTNHCATISLDAITGGASSVVLYSNHSSDPANWNLGTAEDGVYSAGELVLRVGDSTSTGGNRTVNYNFNNAEMFSGTTVTIENAAIGTPGKTMTNNVVLNADEVHVGGINDAAEDTVVDKRNWSVAKGGDVDGRATLVLDADNTEAAYSTAIKVGADVDIRKTGEGVQTFSGDMSSFEGTVAVEKGTINVLNVDELSVQDVVIGAGATLGVYNDATATATSATEGTVAIDEGYSLTAAAGATLNANLVLNAGSALDVSATLGEGLQMGSDVALYTGDLLAVTPWPADESTTDMAVVDAYLRAFFAQGDHEYYTLFTDVDMFSIDEVVQTKDLTFRDWLHFDLDAASVFGNLIENTYALVYHMGANAGEGTVALKMIPEPTTGTLSLLALVALAARRRKHN